MAYGNGYSVASPSIDGYHLNDYDQATMSGTMPAKDVTVIYVANPAPVIPDPGPAPDPDPESTSAPDTDPDVDIDDSDVPLVDMPKTGENSYIWGGAALVSGICLA